MKPHKGRIIVTGKYLCPGYGLGYAYSCYFLDHNKFAGRNGHTSFVVSTTEDIPRHVNDGYEIETRNSRYTVVTDRQFVKPVPDRLDADAGRATLDDDF